MTMPLPTQAAWNWMRRGALCAILLNVTPLTAQSTVQRTPPSSASDWMSSPRVLAAHTRLGTDTAAITEEQVRITAIPAPPFQEAARGAYLARLLSDAGLTVKTDEVGNVIATRPGRSSSSL